MMTYWQRNDADAFYSIANSPISCGSTKYSTVDA